MSHEIYSTLSGMMGVWQQTELIANNLANVSTQAYKAPRASFEQVDHDPRPLGNSFSRLVPGYIDQRDGPIIQDGVETHLAIRGKGMLTVEGANGELLLTRNGNLRLDVNRFLVTQEGERVLGRSGPIQIPQDEKVEIDREGNVTSRRDLGMDTVSTYIDQLQFAHSDDLMPRGGGRYTPLGNVEDIMEGDVVQGALAGSNVDPMNAMVELIQSARYFDIYQRAIQTADSLDQTAYAMPRG